MPTPISHLSTPPQATTVAGTLQQRKLLATCREFESLLVQNLFKGMRSSVPQSGLLDEGKSEEMFRDLLDIEAARSFARQPGLGIADRLYRHLSPSDQTLPQEMSK